MINSFSIVRRTAAKALFASLLFSNLSACNVLDWLKPSSLSRRQQESNRAAEPSNVKLMSPREKLEFHRWLVTEMLEQIYARPIKDKSVAAGWANVLSQRASIEGVYRGLILSSDYLALESGKPSDLKALRFFGNEMAMLDYPAATEEDSRVKDASARYVKDSMRLPIYTLKREMGDRILREANQRKADPEKLAAWYSGIATRWAKYNVNFGLPQRNQKDEAFHFKWAKENTLGMIQWELLNKAHRILNQFAGIAINPNGK
jgi:hypothetical protein